MELRRFSWLLQILPEDTTGKDTLKELFELRRYLHGIPKNWSPQIRSISPSSLQLSPCGLNADATSTEDVLGSSLVPPWASVPLALGVILGDEMSVGIQIQSEAGRASEGVWLGLEMTGVHDGCGLVWKWSILCAPLTGRCMQVFPGHGSFVAQAMPPLAADFTGCVEIYVTVQESGDFEFLRFCPATNSTARSGRMTRDMLPIWA